MPSERRGVAAQTPNEPKSFFFFFAEWLTGEPFRLTTAAASLGLRKKRYFQSGWVPLHTGASHPLFGETKSNPSKDVSRLFRD